MASAMRSICDASGALNSTRSPRDFRVKSPREIRLSFFCAVDREEEEEGFPGHCRCNNCRWSAYSAAVGSSMPIGFATIDPNGRFRDATGDKTLAPALVALRSTYRGFAVCLGHRTRWTGTTKSAFNQKRMRIAGEAGMRTSTGAVGPQMQQ